ncbi:hypothetical protein M758_UG089200 [Ceratodon purpureus]|nr:hypothetical protein M758_UG089200 [Ceratodon purpureus]
MPAISIVFCNSGCKTKQIRVRRGRGTYGRGQEREGEKERLGERERRGWELGATGAGSERGRGANGAPWRGA